MSLPDEYLQYPHRRHGMDQDRYDWDPANRRAPLKLASGVKAMACIIVPVEFFPLNPPAAPFKHPGAMQTPYPDLRHYTTRDYGNRIGIYRLLRELKTTGLTATFAVNAVVAKRYPPLIEAISAAGHEIAAHGVSTAHIHHEGLSETDERALISEARAAFPKATTWMSPARNESFSTPDLLTEVDFSTCLDWEIDQHPTFMRTKHGPLSCIPNYSELGDFKLLIDRSQSEDEWADQIIEAAQYHVAAYQAEGASAFAFTLTPYVAGQPFRIHAVRRILNELRSMSALEVATANTITSAFEKATA